MHTNQKKLVILKIVLINKIAKEANIYLTINICLSC